MGVLICGSMAYDHIMVFKDQFKNHILPDKVHILNVSFLVPEMRREFGGCAGNIAYNLNLLDPSIALPMATVGKDFDSYGYWMDKHNINRKYIKIIEDAFTAQAFITTDMDDNQITAFHPGAMNYSQENDISDVQSYSLGIVSPDGRDGMLKHAQQFADKNIPFVFDPGQGMPMFNGEELIQFIEQATWVTVNDYEWQMMKEKTGLSEKEITEKVEALIVTRGGDGSHIYTKEELIEVPSVKPESISDPTGCGDAYRAGLLYGLINDIDLEITGKIASLMGSIKISCYGTQNHSFTIEEFKSRFESEFGYKI
ncbi:MAG: carbohydrate kinase family protein [Pseudomonadota bacterium]|nr:carbohydrate kinase family protein [Pseudomonadota bacterium]